jgi:hypothetical protein
MSFQQIAGSRGPVLRSTFCSCSSQSTKIENTESRGIPARFCKGHWTAGPQRLPTLPEDHIRRETGKDFADGVEDQEIKVALLIGGEGR